MSLRKYTLNKCGKRCSNNILIFSDSNLWNRVLRVNKFGFLGHHQLLTCWSKARKRKLRQKWKTMKFLDWACFRPKTGWLSLLSSHAGVVPCRDLLFLQFLRLPPGEEIWDKYFETFFKRSFYSSNFEHMFWAMQEKWNFHIKFSVLIKIFTPIQIMFGFM